MLGEFLDQDAVLCWLPSSCLERCNCMARPCVPWPAHSTACVHLTAWQRVTTLGAFRAVRGARCQLPSSLTRACSGHSTEADPVQVPGNVQPYEGRCARARRKHRRSPLLCTGVSCVCNEDIACQCAPAGGTPLDGKQRRSHWPSRPPSTLTLNPCRSCLHSAAWHCATTCETPLEGQQKAQSLAEQAS
jgi:hypothetical protein